MNWVGYGLMIFWETLCRGFELIRGYGTFGLEWLGVNFFRLANHHNGVDGAERMDVAECFGGCEVGFCIVIALLTLSGLVGGYWVC